LELQQITTGLGIRIQGHLKIVEYKDRAAYEANEPSRILLNRRNAVHKENAVNVVVNAMTDRTNHSVSQMVFGNGGTTLDHTGTVTFKTPNVVGTNQNLYNPVFFQMVDDTLGALPGNQMSIRHINNTLFSDIDIRCLLDATQPFSQLPNDMVQPLVLKTTDAPGSSPPTTQFVFDEIGLKLGDGTLLTHVIFVPILKTATSLIEVVYTLRLAVGAPPGTNLDLVHLVGVQATASVPTVLDTNFRIHAVRFNNSPYYETMPEASTDSPQGSLSLWVRSADIFTMSHDIGPAIVSSPNRLAMDFSGRGYVRRNPSLIERINPVRITVPNHGLTGGETITFQNLIGGCSELLAFSPSTNVVTVIDANRFTIPHDGTTFAAAYTGPAWLQFVTPDRATPNTLRLVFRDSDDPNDLSAKEFWWNSATSEAIPSGGWVNLLLSWDMSGGAGAKVLQVYLNDTPLTSTSDPTYRYDPGSGFTIPYATPQWMIGQPAYPPALILFGTVVREVLKSRA
jgi:hypothetical protein